MFVVKMIEHYKNHFFIISEYIFGKSDLSLENKNTRVTLATQLDASTGNRLRL